jgi:hypothetical protein
MRFGREIFKEYQHSPEEYILTLVTVLYRFCTLLVQAFFSIIFVATPTHYISLFDSVYDFRLGRTCTGC